VDEEARWGPMAATQKTHEEMGDTEKEENEFGNREAEWEMLDQ
jgi:hypothetical protein